jgi:hypothetical protein
MGGNGGGGWFPPRRMPSTRQDVDDQIAESDYRAEVSEIVTNSLSNYNDRDAEATRKHLETLKKALSKEIDGVVELSFGGSVSKHSYVDGISDVDVLADVSGTELERMTPKELLGYFAKLVGDRLPGTEVKAGNMAVTVTYSDGTEIQILPTLKTPSGIHVADPNTGKWSSLIRPQAFAAELSRANRESSGMMIPVIKMFKAAQASLPRDSQLEGYHIEALAIRAFGNYKGSATYKDMFQHLCSRIVDDVKTPIHDSTGQSWHVDDSLGPANSTAREKCSKSVKRLADKLLAADSSRDGDAWRDLFNV